MTDALPDVILIGRKNKGVCVGASQHPIIMLDNVTYVILYYRRRSPGFDVRQYKCYIVTQINKEEHNAT